MAAVLLDERHTGQTYSLSGPRTLTMTEVADELTIATGRQVRYVDRRGALRTSVTRRAGPLTGEILEGLEEVLDRVEIEPRRERLAIDRGRGPGSFRSPS